MSNELSAALTEVLRAQADLQRRLRALEALPRKNTVSQTLLEDAVLSPGSALYIPGPIIDGVVTATVTPVVVTQVREEFTYADNTYMVGLAASPTNVPGGTWAGYGQAWVKSNAQTNQFGDGRPIYIESNLSDCIVQGNHNNIAGANSDSGLAVRVTDVNNCWIIAANAGASLFKIIERNAAVETLRASVGVSIGLGVHVIRVVLSGTTITATLDGANQISYSSSTFQSNTLHGTRVSNSNYRVDDFEVLYDSTITTYTAESFTLEVPADSTLEVG